MPSWRSTRRRSSIRFAAAGRFRWKRNGWACGLMPATSTPYPCSSTRRSSRFRPSSPGVRRSIRNLKSQISKSKEWPGATGLAEDVRYYGKWMRDEAEKRIGHLYPKVEVTAEMAKDRPDLEPYVGQKLTVIAWLWARTVASPNPAAKGVHVPLMRSLCLSAKTGKQTYAWPVVDRTNNTYRFDVRTGATASDSDPRKGTVNRSGATCLFTNSPIPFDYIRKEGKAGRLANRLIAIVADGGHGRVYLPPLDEHRAVAESAMPHDYPETELPTQALSFRVMLYGMDKHHKLFTARQLVMLTTLSNLVAEAREKVRKMAGSSPGGAMSGDFATEEMV